MSDEEKEAFKKRKQERREKWNSMSDEDRKKFKEKRKKKKLEK